jgi:hypothetical protein
MGKGVMLLEIPKRWVITIDQAYSPNEMLINYQAISSIRAGIAY